MPTVCRSSRLETPDAHAGARTSGLLARVLLDVRADDVQRHVRGVDLVVDLHDPARVVVRLDRVRAPVHATGEGRDHAAPVGDRVRVEPAVAGRREPVAAAERDLAGRAGDRRDRAGADAGVVRAHVRVVVVRRVAPRPDLVPGETGRTLLTLRPG